MSCSKIQDLEDLAANLFQQSDQQVRAPRKQRQLKKQRKPKIMDDHFKIQQDNLGQAQIDQSWKHKPLGTHSIYVKTFGCSHNISDSQFMIGQLSQYGYKIVESPSEADLVLINSCTVVNPSQDAFINMVIKAKKIKKPLVVAGCVPQGDGNIPQLAEISAVGVTQIDRIVEVVQQTLKGHKVQLMVKKQLPSLDLPKIRKNKDIQIIAINAGCLGACTYCKTVFARGKLLSYSPDAIVARVRSVALEGVKQIWLTSQDTGAYGRDIGTNISQLLVKLCQELQNHQGVMMRIGMTNPPYMLDQLSSIANFLNHPRVFSFIHIPIQAAHNNVLQKMNRQYTVQEFKAVADFFIQHVPDITIATDIICGFAEQTDQQFQASLQLINHYKFRVVNINQFYLRPGTPAANLKQLPTKIIKSRSSKLTQLFRSYQKHSYLVGRQERVWINQKDQHKGQIFLVGHTKNYTKVIIPYSQNLLYQQVIMKITKAYDWHVEGEIINQNPKPLLIDPQYVQNMKKDIIEEKQKIKNRKQAKAQKIRQKKQKLMQERLKRQDVTVNQKNVVAIKIKQQQTKECCENKGNSCCDTNKNSCCNDKQQKKCCGDNCKCNNNNINKAASCTEQKSNQQQKTEYKKEEQQKLIGITQQKIKQVKLQKPRQQKVKQMQYKSTNINSNIYLILSIVCMLFGVLLLLLQ